MAALVDLLRKLLQLDRCLSTLGSGGLTMRAALAQQGRPRNRVARLGRRTLFCLLHDEAGSTRGASSAGADREAQTKRRFASIK